MTDKYGRIVMRTDFETHILYEVQDDVDGTRFTVQYPLGTPIEQALYTINSMAPVYYVESPT